MRERLRFLYGDDLGDRTASDLERLLDRLRQRLGRREPGGPGFDERDAILITYGDTFLSPGEPPLGALGEFAARHLGERVSGVHILPFFPYSSDYGFSVTDYERVNPELGDWDDLDGLRSRFKLMFDFVLNHVSAESGWKTLGKAILLLFSYVMILILALFFGAALFFFWSFAHS